MTLAVDLQTFLRRTALVELARQSALYAPTSHDDAAARLDQVASALDAEILIAADAGQDAVVGVLTTLRAAVVADLTARGASLTPIRTFTVGAPLPADVLAQRFYRDPSRADELTAETGAINPAVPADDHPGAGQLMTDIATVWDVSRLAGAWVVAGPDLQSGGDLETAVIISLFTDGQADPDDVLPDDSEDPRGWAGDADSDVPIGSKLWLLSRTTLTAQTLLTAADYMRQALKWLIDDGVVSTIDVVTSRGGLRRLDAVITLSRTGGPPVKLQFAWAWGS